MTTTPRYQIQVVPEGPLKGVWIWPYPSVAILLTSEIPSELQPGPGPRRVGK